MHIFALYTDKIQMYISNYTSTLLIRLRNDISINNINSSRLLAKSNRISIFTFIMFVSKYLQ